MDYKFTLIEKLPPYVFAVINHLKMEARHRGEDIIDLGMGNPDLATPDPIDGDTVWLCPCLRGEVVLARARPNCRWSGPLRGYGP